jgi:hypothetical protein
MPKKNLETAVRKCGGGRGGDKWLSVEVFKYVPEAISHGSMGYLHEHFCGQPLRILLSRKLSTAKAIENQLCAGAGRWEGTC